MSWNSSSRPTRSAAEAPTLNAGVIVSGGTNFGVLPASAEFACDLRTLPGMTEGDVRDALENWLEKRRAALPGLDVAAEFESQLPWLPPSEIAADHPLVSAVQSAATEVLGVAPPLTVFPGGTDAPWFDRAGIPTIPAFGPGVLTCCHGPNEYIAVESVHQAARMYALTAARYCGVA